MNYTPEQVKKYAELLSFTATPELTEAFLEQNEDEAHALAVFHREVTLLTAVQNLKKDNQEITYLNIRDYLIEKVFKGDVDRVGLEKNLDYLLPKLIQRKLLTKKMNLTKLGKSLVQHKVVAFDQAAQQISELPN